MRTLANQLGRLWQFIVTATREVCMRIILAILLFSGYLVCSMIVYAAMRQLLVPQKTHVLPVHLYFNPQCSDGSYLFDSKHTKKHSSFKHFQEKSCPFPFAEFLLASGERLLTPGHSYTAAVELEMPESPQNENLGMFMINLTLHSNTGTTLGTSIRPAILHYKSSLLHTFSTLFYALPLLLGLTEQKQIISTVMLDNYQETYFTDGSIYARVTIMSHSIQLYSAQLTFDANFTGLAYYLYHWPISMAIIIISGMFFTVTMVTVLMWFRQAMDSMGRFQYYRRHQRMNLRAPAGLDPIPEEEEIARRPQQPIEDLSTTATSDGSTNDIPDNASTISSATEVATDFSETNTDIEEIQLAPPNTDNDKEEEQHSTLRYRSNI